MNHYPYYRQQPYYPWYGYQMPYLPQYPQYTQYPQQYPMQQPPMQQQTDQGVTQMSVQNILSSWDNQTKKEARKLIRKYGLPNEATKGSLIWYKNGEWERTILSRETIPHKFPKPHRDFLMQTVKYKVPANMFDNIARFDGSIIIDRTPGEVSARCHMEPMNRLALNLMHDIVTGKRSVMQARDFYGEMVKKFEAGEKSPYTEKLLFTPQMNTSYPDKTTI